MELHLKLGEELLGVLRSTASDFPWVNCKFEPTASFVKVQPLFDEELTLLDADRMDEWQIAYDRISALGLQLMDTKDETDIGEFLLHIRGNEAWFRS
jgi:hypothetical protein